MIVFVYSTAQCHKTLRSHKLQYSIGADHPDGICTTTTVLIYPKYWFLDQNLN